MSTTSMSLPLQPLGRPRAASSTSKITLDAYPADTSSIGRSSSRADTLSRIPSAARTESIDEEYDPTPVASDGHVSQSALTGEENYLDGGYGWVVTGGKQPSDIPILIFRRIYTSVFATRDTVCLGSVSGRAGKSKTWKLGSPQRYRWDIGILYGFWISACMLYQIVGWTLQLIIDRGLGSCRDLDHRRRPLYRSVWLQHHSWPPASSLAML